MGLKFSCFQIIKSNKSSQTIYKRSRCKQRIPPPPPRRQYSINQNITKPKPPPPPPKTTNKTHDALHEYHGLNITQTKTTNLIQLQIVNNNTLTIPSSNHNHNNSRILQIKRGTSMTGTMISNTNISALSSAVSMISTLSNVDTHIHSPSSNANTLTETSNTLNTVYSDNYNNNTDDYTYDNTEDKHDLSSETSVSIITSANETSVSTESSNVPSSPISPSDTDDTNSLLDHLIVNTPDMDHMDQNSLDSITHAKTLCYDGDVDDTLNDGNASIVDIYSDDSGSAHTFITCQDNDDVEEENEDNDMGKDIGSYFVKKINVSNVVSNASNISNSSFLSPINIANINLPNRLAVTTQLSQLLDEHVKIITLTQTMDVKNVKPCDLSKEEVRKMYNGGFISVKSTSVTPLPKPIDEIINPLCDINFDEINGTKLDINDIEKCLESNDENNQQYVD